MNLTLPFPPSVNGYWRATNKGMLISARGRVYRSNAIAVVYEQVKRKPKPQPLTAELDVHVVLFPPTRGCRDVDNFRKALFDSLTHAGVWADDSQVKRMTVEWGDLTKDGKVEVRIIDFKPAGVQPA